MEGADESTELWRHPTVALNLHCKIFIGLGPGQCDQKKIAKCQ